MQRHAIGEVPEEANLKAEVLTKTSISLLYPQYLVLYLCEGATYFAPTITSHQDRPNSIDVGSGS